MLYLECHPLPASIYCSISSCICTFSLESKILIRFLNVSFAEYALPDEEQGATVFRFDGRGQPRVLPAVHSRQIPAVQEGHLAPRRRPADSVELAVYVSEMVCILLTDSVCLHLLDWHMM